MKKIIYLIMFLIVVSSVYADELYQETATSYTYLNDNFTASHPAELSFDGNWSTFSETYDITQYGTVYINYDKPTGVTNKTEWVMKVGLIGNEIGTFTTNLSFESYYQSCWDYSETELVLRIRTSDEGFVGVSKGECYNGTGWMYMAGGSGDSTLRNIYEEAILWDGIDIGEPTEYVDPDICEVCIECVNEEFGSSLPLGGIISLFFMVFVFFLLYENIKKWNK